jgi:membrane dipeptidase
MIKRRKVIQLACGASLASLVPTAQAASDQVPLADAHSHLGLIQRTLRQADFLTQAKESGLSLISWCIVPDGPWLKQTNTGIVQASRPGSGQVSVEFKKQLAAVKGYLADNNIKIALTQSDVDAAMSGEIRVVLSSEAADFVEGDLNKLAEAQSLGLRHTQLVHYIESDLGDLQTIAPRHGGWTSLGESVIKECNRLGILVDLAHCDLSTVNRALDVSSRPMIWSHGWVAPTQGRPDDWIGILSRRISWDLAKKITNKGGVIGLWSVGITDASLSKYPEYPIAIDPQRRLKSYAQGMAQMVKELGADHVCFGTDMEGVGPIGVVNYYKDLRQVANLLSDAGLNDVEIQKVCIGNYARVLKQSLLT